MPTERIIYVGRVQGVGFRYSVREIAKRHPVTGYVINRPDGTVELVAQGELPAMNLLLSDIAEKFRRHIDHCERGDLPNAEVFQTFDIRY